MEENLTSDFLPLCNTKELEFDEFMRNFYWICNHNELQIDKNGCRHYFAFLDFLGLDKNLYVKLQ